MSLHTKPTQSQDTPLITHNNVSNMPKIAAKLTRQYQLDTNYTLPKPQLLFEDFIDNSEVPFIPKIKYKCYKKKELSELINNSNKKNDIQTQDQLNLFSFSNCISKCSLPHPYQQELESLTFTDIHTTKINAVDLSKFEFTWIADSKSFTKMIEELKKFQEITVDVQEHSFRSYLGFACMIQISTADKCYLIDSIQLRDILQCLNEIMTDHDITKVIIGDNNALLWLQRDFGIYVINAFDLIIAGKKCCLSEESYSEHMKNLLKVDAFNIRIMLIGELDLYQLVFITIINFLDLNNYLVQRSRSALNIYKILQNKLIDIAGEKDLIDIGELFIDTLNESKQKCLQKYEKPRLRDANIEFTFPSSVSLKPLEKQILNNLYKWRDGTARFEDESSQYVLPNHILYEIASQKVRNTEHLEAICNDYVPEMVAKYCSQILNIVEKTIEQNQMFIKESPKKKNIDCLKSYLSPPSTFEQRRMMLSSAKKAIGAGYSKEKEFLYKKKIIDDDSATKSPPILASSDLYKVLEWNKDCDYQEYTPEKEYQAILTKRILTPSMFSDSSEDISDDEKVDKKDGKICLDILNKINNTNFDIYTSADKRKLNTELDKYYFDNNDSATKPDHKLINSISSPSFKIPQNLKEIFKISNNNRKKNKEKKKNKCNTKSESCNDLLKLMNENCNSNIHITQKDNISFLKKLGWLNSKNEKYEKYTTNQPYAKSPFYQKQAQSTTQLPFYNQSNATKKPYTHYNKNSNANTPVIKQNEVNNGYFETRKFMKKTINNIIIQGGKTYQDEYQDNMKYTHHR